MRYLLILLLISNISHAADAVFLNKGSPAPSDGVLLSPEAARKANANVIELQATKNINLSLSQEKALYEERLKFYQDDNKQLTERIQKSDTSTLERTFYFISGALITGIISYGVYKTR